MYAATGPDLGTGPSGARMPGPQPAPGQSLVPGQDPDSGQGFVSGQGPASGQGLVPGDGLAPGGQGLAERIDTLFRTVHPPGSTRQYTYEEVADAIADSGGPTISASYLYMLRRGIRDNPTKRHLEALARFFGVSAGYFFDDEDPVGAGPSALRNPQAIAVAAAAAAVSPASLQVILQTVELVADLERAQDGRPQPEAGPDGNVSGKYPGSPDRIELELARAELELQSGQATESLRRLAAVLDAGSGKRHRNQAAWLVARAHEALGQREQALQILHRMLDECLDGGCHLSAGVVGERICELALASGDPRLAVRVGQQILDWAEQRGLKGTMDHLRILSLLMRAHLEAGESASATEHARHLIIEADRVPDLLQQATIYTDCARTAEARGRLEEAAALAGKALAAVSQATSQDSALLTDLTRLRVQAAGCLAREGPHHAEIGRRTLEGLRGALAEQTTPMDQGYWATELAAAHLALGEPGEAETSARRALAVFGDPHLVTARAHILLGDALHDQGRHSFASSEHEEAGRVLAGLPTPPPLRWTAMTWRALGERWQERGLHDQAAQAFRKSLDLVAVWASDPMHRACPDGYPRLNGVLNHHK